jgi:hypothetical protein
MVTGELFFVIDNNGYHGRIRQQKKKEYIVVNMLLKVEAMEIGPPVRTKKFFFSFVATGIPYT